MWRGYTLQPRELYRRATPAGHRPARDVHNRRYEQDEERKSLRMGHPTGTFPERTCSYTMETILGGEDLRLA